MEQEFEIPSDTRKRNARRTYSLFKCETGIVLSKKAIEDLGTYESKVLDGLNLDWSFVDATIEFLEYLNFSVRPVIVKLNGFNPVEKGSELFILTRQKLFRMGLKSSQQVPIKRILGDKYPDSYNKHRRFTKNFYTQASVARTNRFLQKFWGLAFVLHVEENYAY